MILVCPGGGGMSSGLVDAGWADGAATARRVGVAEESSEDEDGDEAEDVETLSSDASSYPL
jgi:hypothetical protein